MHLFIVQYKLIPANGIYTPKLGR